MTSSLVKRAATLIGATATAGALVLSTPGLADAATYNQGNFSDTSRTVRNGSGDADVHTRANNAGRLSVNTQARGGAGDDGGILGGGGPTETRASGQAFLRKRVPAASGTYSVVVRYEGLKGKEFDRGNGDANVTRRSVVQYVAQSGGGNRRIVRVAQNPERGNKQHRVVIDVPRGSSGFLLVTARLGASSTASGNNNIARSNISAKDVDFVINRLNG